jgi:hypothetical protein
MKAAVYIDFPAFTDLAFGVFAAEIKRRPLDEVKVLLRLSKELTPEEDIEIRQQNKWIFENPKRPHPNADAQPDLREVSPPNADAQPELEDSD